MYAEIALIRNDKDTDKLFTYEIPEFMEFDLKIGDKVSVSFGRGKNQLMGFVFDLHTSIPDFKTKEILQIFSPVYSLSEKQIDLCNWMRKKYACTYAQAIKTIVPKELIKGSKPAFKTIIRLHPSISSLDDIDSKLRRNASKQRNALTYLFEKGKVEERSFMEEAGITRALLSKMIERKYILSKSIRSKIDRQPVNESNSLNEFPRNMLCMLDSPDREACYLHYIDEAAKTNKSTLIVSNEISEAKALFEKFSRRYECLNPILSAGNISLSALENIQQSILSGKTRLIFGTRNSVFLPYENLGLIIVDRENEYGHKSDSMPKFHTCEIVEFLKRSHKARLIYSDITPSVECYNKNSGNNALFIGKNSKLGNLGSVLCVDMKKELKSGNRTMFSSILDNGIRTSIKSGKGIAILLNQKGHSTSVACRSCGYVMKCPSCGLSLSYYSEDDTLRCPYCSYRVSSGTVCPSCGSGSYKFFGTGPEKVKSELKERFPLSNVLLINSESTKPYPSLQKAVEAFNSGKHDIMVTTEFILKKNLIRRPVLFAILNADMFLYGQDYRSNERFFSLARKIRSSVPQKGSELLIQSYDPSQMAIRHALKDDYDEFFKEELAYRKTLNLPPFFKMAVFHIFGDNETNVLKSAQSYSLCLEKASQDMNVKILGPSKNSSLKYKSKYKYQLVVKYAPVDIKKFMGIIKYVNDNRRNSFRKLSVKLSYDIDSR